MRRIQLTAIAVSLVFLLPAGVASATPTWLAPRDLSAGQGSGIARVALDAAGDAFAVWSEFDGSSNVIQASVRPAGGDWSAAQDLSPGGQDGTIPALAVNPAGAAVAVWTSYDGKAHAALRPAGGAWGAPQDLSDAPELAESPEVALDQAGNAVAVWTRLDGSFHVRASWRPAGGTWTAPQDISPAGESADDPQVALDAAGNAVALWVVRSDGSTSSVQTASRPAGGSWGSPQNLSASGQHPYGPQLALDHAGSAVAVWPSEDGIIRTAERPAGGVWGAPKDLSAAGQTAYQPQVALGPAGNAVAIWDRFDGSNYVVQTSRRAAGAWAQPETLSAPGQDAVSPDVALDPLGNAVAVWSRWNDSGQSIVHAALRPVGADWAPPQDLSALGWDADTPSVAFDGTGNAAAVWRRYNGSHVVIQAAGLDAAGPLIGGISVTGKLIAGGRVRFSPSSIADVWSALAGPPHWFFGDGAQADATNVTHVYRNPGHYSVTVSEADWVGNQGSALTTLTIAPAPCIVPRVVGQTLARAKRAIKKAHCRAGRIGHAFSRRIRTGHVVSQHPKPKTRLRSGGRVNLVVSRGRR